MMSEGGKAQITTNDAMAYMQEVKDAFQDKNEEYDYFLKLMTDLKEQRIDTEGAMESLKELFKEHTELIVGFKVFLPKEYKIKLRLLNYKPPPQRMRGGFEDATHFVKKVKIRFHGNDHHVYRSFLDTLRTLREGNKSITETYNEVTTLFQGHVDLLHELNYFFK